MLVTPRKEYYIEIMLAPMLALLCEFKEVHTIWSFSLKKD